MEKLKSIFGDKALTWEQFQAALAENKDIKLADLSLGGYVGKEKFAALEAKYNNTFSQLETANKKLEGFDPEWKIKAQQAQENADKAVEKVKFDYALSAALNKAKAKNNIAVKALLNMDGLKLSGDEIVGLNEQLDKIKSENGYLFNADSTAPPPSFGRSTPGASGNAHGGDDLQQRANAAIRSLFTNSGD